MHGEQVQIGLNSRFAVLLDLSSLNQETAESWLELEVHWSASEFCHGMLENENKGLTSLVQERETLLHTRYPTAKQILE